MRGWWRWRGVRAAPGAGRGTRGPGAAGLGRGAPGPGGGDFGPTSFKLDPSRCRWLRILAMARIEGAIPTAFRAHNSMRQFLWQSDVLQHVRAVIECLD